MNKKYAVVLTVLSILCLSPLLVTQVSASGGSIPTYYQIVFDVSGMVADGHSWSVTFDGITHTAITPSGIIFGVTEGTYDYTVEAPGYTVTPSSGTVNVAGGQTIHISFAPQVIIFQESPSLPTGTTWTVTLDGVTKTSTEPVIVFEGVPAGSHTYSVDSTGFKDAYSSGTFTSNAVYLTEKQISFAMLEVLPENNVGVLLTFLVIIISFSVYVKTRNR